MKIISVGLLIFLLQSSVILLAAEKAEADYDNWSLKKDSDAVQVYTRNVPDSPYDAVRSITIVNDLRMSSMIALLLDSAACPDWADRCAQSYVHEKISDTELLVYTLNDLPFPIKNRDILSRVYWSQDPQTLEVVMNSEATQGILEVQKGKLRLTEANVSWKFRPLDSGAIEVTNEAHVNPGSALPGWLINMLLIDTPFETMKAFREAAADSKYADAVVSFVTEPG